MGTVFIDKKEQEQLLDSRERSMHLVDKIYGEIASWRMHGLESHQKKANSLKKQLDDVLEDVMPMNIINTNSYSPPSQKRRAVFYGGRGFTRRRAARAKNSK